MAWRISGISRSPIESGSQQAARQSRNSKTGDLANDEDFADVVAAEEEFPGTKVEKQILDVTVVEDSLETRSRLRLQLKCIRLNDMVAAVRGVQTGILGMKKCQQASFGSENGVHAVYQGPHYFFRKIIRYIPEQDGV